MLELAQAPFWSPALPIKSGARRNEPFVLAMIQLMQPEIDAVCAVVAPLPLTQSSKRPSVRIPSTHAGENEMGKGKQVSLSHVVTPVGGAHAAESH